mmetsp:Transcript_13722/g.22626  ORF Transcript_13722/g.22626 Transcript_13722/m.22626 type:complete len:235 (+) Transcript_13722:289-993(+)
MVKLEGFQPFETGAFGLICCGNGFIPGTALALALGGAGFTATPGGALKDCLTSPLMPFSAPDLFFSGAFFASTTGAATGRGTCRGCTGTGCTGATFAATGGGTFTVAVGGIIFAAAGGAFAAAGGATGGGTFAGGTLAAAGGGAFATGAAGAGAVGFASLALAFGLALALPTGFCSSESESSPAKRVLEKCALSTCGACGCGAGAASSSPSSFLFFFFFFFDFFFSAAPFTATS